MIDVEPMEPIAPGNPFLSDAFRMGMKLGDNVIAMFERHDNQRQPYIIIVNTETGERVRITLDDSMTGVMGGRRMTAGDWREAFPSGFGD